MVTPTFHIRPSPTRPHQSPLVQIAINLFKNQNQTIIPLKTHANFHLPTPTGWTTFIAEPPCLIDIVAAHLQLSVEHATATRTLVDRTAQMNRRLIGFLVEFLRVTTRQTTSGVEEMAKLSQTITELQMVVQQVFTSTAELKEPNVIHLVYVCSRFVSSSRRGSRSKLRRPIVLESELTDLGALYETFDHKHNEMAHAQYTTQLRQNRNDPVTFAQNHFFAFVQELILTSESALTLSVAVWTRLRVDCGHLFKWLTAPVGGMADHQLVSPPPVIAAYLEVQNTVYLPLTTGMDAYVASIDACPYVNEDSSS